MNKRVFIKSVFVLAVVPTSLLAATRPKKIFKGVYGNCRVDSDTNHLQWFFEQGKENAPDINVNSVVTLIQSDGRKIYKIADVEFDQQKVECIFFDFHFVISRHQNVCPLIEVNMEYYSIE